MTEYEKMLWWLDSGQLIGVADRKAIANFIRAQSARVEALENATTRALKRRGCKHPNCQAAMKILELEVLNKN